MLASCSADREVNIWNISTESLLYSIKTGWHHKTKYHPKLTFFQDESPIWLDWNPKLNIIIIGDEKGFTPYCSTHRIGRATLWEYESSSNKGNVIKDFGSIKAMRWNDKVPTTLAVGCEDGSIILYDITSKGMKTIKTETKELVSDLQWDPLSDNYLLVAHKNGNYIEFPF